MSKPIHKLCLIKGFTEAYYQLSETEQTALWNQVGEGIEKFGAKMVGPYYDCRWSNDKYSVFFLMEYPDITAAISETANVEKLGLFRYVVSETILGTIREE